MISNGLLYRREIKYILNYSEYITLASFIKGIARYDRFAPADGRYSVRSLYFDDMHNSAYTDKKLGLPNRYKFRIRNYNSNSDNMKLEKKYKRGDWGSKESAKISEAEYSGIINGSPIGITQSSGNLFKAFYADTSTKGLKPKIIVDYQREAFVWQMGQDYLRFTFDSRLRWAMDSLDIFDSKAVYINAFDDDKHILEIKYHNFLPEIISDLLKPLNRFPSGSSKYQLCRKQKENMFWRG